MKPTLAAAQLRGSLLQYLTTTYALADEDTRRALERFLGDPESSIFRGPYPRIRTPFHQADETWRSALEWDPDFPPYRHQAQAWQGRAVGHGAHAGHVLVPAGEGTTEGGGVRCGPVGDRRPVVSGGAHLGLREVSTTTHLERQLDALEAMGIADNRISVDKKSGASADRPGLADLLPRTVPRTPSLCPPSTGSAATCVKSSTSLTT